MSDKPVKKTKLVQYQKPMAVILTALAGPVLFGTYNFGLRVLAVVAVCNLTAFITEYLFMRNENKPVTMAAFVTGTLLALTLPPNIPFWMAILGSAFALVFGKMVFGGFGKNIFNPALVGRCFLYIAFPLAMAGTWVGPIEGPVGGFAQWTANSESQPVQEIVFESNKTVDGVTGATTLAGVKKLSAYANAEPGKAPIEKEEAIAAVENISYLKLFLGRVSGSQGETSALIILLGFLYMLYRKTVIWQLAVGPLLGMVIGTLFISLFGISPLHQPTVFGINVFAGGTFFALAFMTTEPVSAPMDKRARWVYGALIGFLAVIIRTMSVFNAGLMFSILLGNTFGPLIEAAFKGWDNYKKEKASAQKDSDAKKEGAA